MVLAKGFAIAILIEVLAERRQAKLGDVARGLAIEPHDVAQHRPEAEVQDIALLGENAGEIAARIFEIAVVERDRERHFRRLGGRPQMREQRRQIRVGDLVIDDEAGVDRDRSRLRGSIDSVAMAAGATLGFENGHVMLLAEQPGGRKTRYARPHHRNIQPARGFQGCAGVDEHCLSPEALGARGCAPSMLLHPIRGETVFG